MGSQELQSQLHVPELGATPMEVNEELRRALAHPTLEEAKKELYVPCAD